MAAKKYEVLKTFDSSKGLKRQGQIVSFNSEKLARDHVERGLVREKKKPGRKPQSEKVKSKQPGQNE